MAARGGVERWQAIRSLRMTGRAFAGPGREALVTREIKRPGRVRTEFTFQGLTGVYAFDGKRGWQVSPLTGILDPRPSNRRMRRWPRSRPISRARSPAVRGRATRSR